MQYKAVIFDMDGTILDTLDDFIYGFNGLDAIEVFYSRLVFDGII